jgi:hypothetical protein
MRIKANNRLYEEAEHLLTRPVGRPSLKPRCSVLRFFYRAASRRRSRRVVAKIEWHQDGLFPRMGFIITPGSGYRRSELFFSQREGDESMGESQSLPRRR